MTKAAPDRPDRVWAYRGTHDCDPKPWYLSLHKPYLAAQDKHETYVPQSELDAANARIEDMQRKYDLLAINGTQKLTDANWHIDTLRKEL